MRIFIGVLFLLLLQIASAQPTATKAEARLEGVKQREALTKSSLLSNVPAKNIGPTVFSGRVVDLAVNPEDPTEFYVAYASGGLWHTTNNGQSFSPLFDQEAVMTLGDIAVNWKTGVIWVGTGENNSSRSSYSGLGMYKSTDWGKSWSWLGLPESHHIGRIVLHPTDPNTLWVAVLGHLYSENPERGVYKSTDGGQTWRKTLYKDPLSGAVDLVMEPGNPDVLYAALWQKDRKSWNFVESGTGTGIYRSADGGETWALLTDAKSGFPATEGAGRIGLDITKTEKGVRLMAVIDNYDRRPAEDDKEPTEGLQKEDFMAMSQADFQSLADKDLDKFLKDNRFPKEYSASSVKQKVQEGVITPASLAEYLEDANRLLFDTEVIGAEVYRSDNDGKSWKKVHDDYLDAVFYSYGYYFGQLRMDARDPDKVYILGVPVIRSDDGGANWTSIGSGNVHGDHHALWVNPERHGHLILGNDGGINISYDDGETWVKCNSPSVGQFYAINVDRAEPYHVYGGTQDNGVWGGPNTYRASNRWHGSGRYPYQRLMGGDGMQVEVDYRDNQTVYTGFQFGNYFRVHKQTGARKRITPQHELGERPLRWNWQTPIHLSRHNQDILYMGANKLFRSFNKGDDFEAISGDLTKGGQKGDVPFGTLATIDESPLKFGLLYTGSDDGLIHVSQDGGHSWQKISDDLPQDQWVSRVEASHHEEGRVYISLNGYRWDDFSAYVYMSDDYGKSWTRIGTDLPAEPVNVVREDPHNPDLIFVGTDHAVYASLDRGKSFMRLSAEIPATPVHDLVIQPEARHLLVGTHGRSIYQIDIHPIEELTQTQLAEAVHLYPVKTQRYRESWGDSFSPWSDPNTPEMDMTLYAQHAGKGQLRVKAVGKDLVLFNKQVDLAEGLNYLEYDLSVNDAGVKAWRKAAKAEDMEELPEAGDNGTIYLTKGTYMVEIEQNGKVSSQKLTIK